MASSSATTVAAYLAALPAERRAVVSAVRDVVVRHLPAGYRETMNWGMISYELPLERYPDTYNKQPLSYVALAVQKAYYSLYLMAEQGAPAKLETLESGFRAAGKRLDMGKSCLRFRSVDDLPLDVIGRAVAGTPPDRLIEIYEASRKR